MKIIYLFRILLRHPIITTGFESFHLSANIDYVFSRYSLQCVTMLSNRNSYLGFQTPDNYILLVSC